MRNEAHVIERIVAGFDPESAETPALDIAAALALALRVELAGLYVEDERLLRLAALPFAQEYYFESSDPRRVVSEDIERALRAQAERLRRAMAKTAERLAIRWRLDVVRGEMPRSALERAGESDLLVVGGPRYRPLALGPRGMPAAKPHALKAHPIAVLFDATPAATHALSLATRCATRVGGDIIALIAAPDIGSFRERREEVERQIAKIGDVSHTHLSFTNIFAAEPEAIERALRGRHAAALFGPRSEASEIIKLRARLSVPLVLVG